MNIRLATLLGFFAFLLTVSAPGQAQENGWPRTLPLTEGSVTIYPLQVESMTGDLVRFRAALAYRESADAEPVFGAGWFVSKVEIDRTNNVVHQLNLVVSDTRFPAGTADVKQELTAVFAQQSQGWNLDFPLTELVSALETAEQEAKSVQNLNTAPPTIVYKDHPALLVSFDGEPVLRKVENSDYQAVINTSYPLIYDGKAYYLGAADNVWYRADSATGPYRFESRPPAGIVAMVDAAKETETDSQPVEKVTAANAPEIVVATTPTELIVTEGPAAFVPLVDDLLVLSNTSDDVFMHISTQQYYIVLAGRWYHSRSLNGPWAYSASDDLPAAFANIPEQSVQADARVYVAGTEEAREAVLDAQIPQTAAIERGVADIEVSYDGEPSFEPVEGTEDLAYANNTGSTVLQADRQYYLVEDGVWYVSSFPNGPWEVSAYRPTQVAAISPQSPVYNVKYVYIYDSTPDVVYVGYTPGYLGNYVYYDTIVYGTGWYYRPWVTPYYYYPRYNTWGFNVSYNSWNGWSFGLSWGWGPFYAGYYSGGYWHHGHSWYNPRYSCWGPRGYHPRPAPYGRYSYGHGSYNRGGYDRGGYDRGGYDRGGYDRGGYDRGGYDRGGPGGKGSGPGYSKHGGGDTYVRNQNLYRDGAQRAKVADNGSYARNGEKLNRVARQDAGAGKSNNGKARPVTSSELRVKAQAREAKYGELNGNLMAKNSGNVKSRKSSPAAGNKGSWETLPATNEVRRTGKSSQSDKTRNVSSGKSPQAQQKQQRSAAPVKSSPQSSTSRYAPSGKSPQAQQKQQRSTAPVKSSPQSSTARYAPSGKSPQAQQKQQRSAAPVKSSPQSSTARYAPSGKSPQAQQKQQRSAAPVKSSPQSSTARYAPSGKSPQAQQKQQRSAAPVKSSPQSSTARYAAPGKAPSVTSNQRSAPSQKSTRTSAPPAQMAQAGAPQKNSGRQAAQATSRGQKSAPAAPSRQSKSSTQSGNRDGGGQKGGRNRRD